MMGAHVASTLVLLDTRLLLKLSLWLRPLSLLHTELRRRTHSSVIFLLSSSELRANLHRPLQFIHHFQNLQFEITVEPVGA